MGIITNLTCLELGQFQVLTEGMVRLTLSRAMGINAHPNRVLPGKLNKADMCATLATRSLVSGHIHEAAWGPSPTLHVSFIIVES